MAGRRHHLIHHIRVAAQTLIVASVCMALAVFLAVAGSLGAVLALTGAALLPAGSYIRYRVQIAGRRQFGRKLQALRDLPLA